MFSFIVKLQQMRCSALNFKKYLEKKWKYFILYTKLYVGINSIVQIYNIYKCYYKGNTAYIVTHRFWFAVRCFIG